MAYVGAHPQKQLTKVTSQSFNGDGSTTAFTLNRAVNTGEELEVFVDNLQQEPGSSNAYTAAGTALTFTEAPQTGTGNIYVIYRGLAEVTTRLEVDPNSTVTAAAFVGDGSGLTNAGGGEYLGDSGGGLADIVRVHEKQLDTSITIAANTNGLCAGPLTLATGVTITVSTGATLVVA